MRADKLFKIGGMSIIGVPIVIAVGAYIYFLVYWMQIPYPLTPADLEIGNTRSPEENVDLIKKSCAPRDFNCPCFMKHVYLKTSRIERVLFLYWDSWSPHLNIRAGAQKLGIHDHELKQTLETAKRKMISIGVDCGQLK